jgi:NAD(P)-dependent dehydrogenase (short-subunit alcohol dehydrogenase family)
LSARFHNQRWFVTGGSRGIGAGIVHAAVSAGHDVVFCYRGNASAAEKTVAEAKALRDGAVVHALVCDVADSRQVEAAADQALELLEGVDVLVNCAGINADNLLVQMSDEEWRSVMATNLDGPFYTCRQFLPQMMSRKFGRIVNVSSIQHNGGTGQANYAASKSGMHGLTKTIAKEYGRRGITANVVVPGFFDTDMTRDTMPQLNKDYWSQYCPMPKGRMGYIAELAGTVVFLASEAGGFINGQVLPVTGGLDWTY